MNEYKKGVLVGIVSTVLIAGAGVAGYHTAAQQGIIDNPEVVSKLTLLEQLIDENYLYEFDENTLAEGMYTGLVSGLGDIYSRYYTAEEYEQELTASEGSFVGIGVLLSEHEKGALIDQVYKGNPGERAGLLEDDIITEIDGEILEGMELREITGMVRDAGETTITLTVERGEESLELPVELGPVEIPFVSYEMLEDHVGYLQILEFGGVTVEQYKNAMEELTQQGMEKLVVDLRDNPGGYLDVVCDILREILPEGRIVYTEDKYGYQEEELCDGEHMLEIPMVVLVNEDSASASEIFAGAVQDYEMGTIVGTTTFGKGIVQSIRQLQDGSAIKLTVSNYYTPNGNNIHEIGITPDVVIEMEESVAQVTHEEDVQLQKALEILKEE